MKKTILSAPGTPILLHACCAPCCGEIIAAMLLSEIEFSIFFYNPNIHPEHEYLKRKNEIINYAKKNNISFYDSDYDTKNWFKITKNLEKEPEGQKRCQLCFRLRLEKTAEFAHKNNFKVFTTSLSISRRKPFDIICEEGVKASNKYPNLIYWTHNWRKKGGSERMYKIAKQENFYLQQYCGCIYSQNGTVAKCQRNL
jgi:epoxyqueuosine reductase